MKSINISTKITLLILLLSLVAVTAVSFFTYDYLKKTNQEKFITNLSVIADNRAGYFSSYLDKVVTSIRSIQEADVIKSGGSTPSGTATENQEATTLPVGNASESTEDVLSSSSTSANSVLPFLQKQKEIFGLEEILITSPTGNIVVSTNGKSGSFLDPDGSTFNEATKGIYFSIIRKDSSGYHSYAGAPITTPAGAQLLIVKLNLNQGYAILKDQRGLGQTGEVILAQFNPLTKKNIISKPTP